MSDATHTDGLGKWDPRIHKFFDRLRTFDAELFVHAGGAGLVLVGIGDHVEIQNTRGL